MPDDEHPAARLGRQCAEAGVDLKTAQMVFRSIYFASALAATGNNRSKAAKLAGVGRRNLLMTLYPSKEPKRDQHDPPDEAPPERDL